MKQGLGGALGGAGSGLFKVQWDNLARELAKKMMDEHILKGISNPTPPPDPRIIQGDTLDVIPFREHDWDIFQNLCRICLLPYNLKDAQVETCVELVREETP